MDAARETSLPSLARLRPHRTTRDPSSLPSLSPYHASVARATVCDAHGAIDSDRADARATSAGVACPPPPTSHDPSRTPIHRGIHVIPSHPIPSHPIPSHPIPCTRHGVHARALRAKNPNRIPIPAGCLRGGMSMGGYIHTSHDPLISPARPTDTDTQTDAARFSFTRDMMTTVTVHHTFTTTIASPPPHAPDHRCGPSHPPRVDVVVAAVAPPVGTSTDGTRRRISRRAIDRSRARRTRRRIRIRIRISTHVASPTTAFERIRARHCIAFAPRAHSFERARAFVARDARGGDSGVERGGVRESERG